MALARTKGVPFALGGKVGSAELNAIDQNIENALDRRAGQTDTLGSVVTLSGAGRIVQAPAAGVDASTTWQATGANRAIYVTSVVTADRNYTLGNTGAQSGDSILIFCDSTFVHEITVKNHNAAVLYALGNLSTSAAPWAEFVYNGTNWLLFRSPTGVKRYREAFTSNGSFTVPAGVFLIDVEGCGPGGTGGSGAAGAVSTTVRNTGGGGGGGALLCRCNVAVTPADVHAVTLGAAGTSTTLGALVTFLGADVGATGVLQSDQLYAFNGGGGPVRGVVHGALRFYSNALAARPTVPPMQPGQGGWGTNYAVSGTADGNGASNLTGGFSGGSGGGRGTGVGSNEGGGGGGGGGAGPYGDGGAGGVGGNGSNAGSGLAGAAGTAAAANTGAGGGGGGSGGNGSAGSGGAAGSTGAGGTGRLYVSYVK